ncbi:hypothetical protein GP486_006379 [Trichoglossum hirsutum]|uniref:HNH nuclease domain-containing protein n=1 Tax=Trichoglossum hirsutum TaxID=265104 RepID=A0A9P8L5M5_9PEZI|nr:hypothetical protein GP486_006379 [Trichoglossum hirsutum]
MPSNSSPFEAPTTAQTNISARVNQRDFSCRISDHKDCTSCVHIVPKTEYEWFTSNGMDLYNLEVQPSGLSIMDDIRNVLRLRHDLHFDFDNKKFVFVPKPIPTQLSSLLPNSTSPDRVSGSGSSRPLSFVTHVLKPTHELGRLYHNTLLHPTPGVRPEFILARFAWTIFPSVTPFLERGIPRSLIRLSASGEQIKYEIVETDGYACRVIAGIPPSSAASSRTSSPKKRQRQPSLDGGENEGNELKRRFVEIFNTPPDDQVEHQDRGRTLTR